MSRFGKPNPTGRSSGKRTGRSGTLYRPPKGEPWVWLTRELICSVAWQAMGINSRRFLDFLLLEQIAHAGTENGGLLATYDQLEQFGLSRPHISEAIDEAIALGLVRVDGGRFRRVATRYRLTMYASLGDLPATNEWKRITAVHVAALRAERRAQSDARKAARDKHRRSAPALVAD